MQEIAEHQNSVIEEDKFNSDAFKLLHKIDAEVSTTIAKIKFMNQRLCIYNIMFLQMFLTNTMRITK